MQTIIIKFITAILIGGIIGYITNDIAIWMLFHPEEKWWIFHGVIPKNQARLAEAIGDMVARNLLDTETLKKSLLTDESFGKVRAALKQALNNLHRETRTVEELLETHIPAETLAEQTGRISHQAADFITGKICAEKPGKTIVQYGFHVLAENSTVVEMYRNFVSDAKMTEMGAMVDAIIAEKAPGLIEHELLKVRDELAENRICDIYERYADREDELLDRAVSIIRTLLEDNMERLMREINLRQIVVDKINSLDPAELEKMIKDVVKKELSFVVWAGAVLGALMGVVQGVINLIL